LDPRDVAEMLTRSGFSVLRVYHLGVVPATERSMPVPAGAMLMLESIARKLPLAGLANEWIYVCRPT
jgi:hypothetical protein